MCSQSNRSTRGKPVSWKHTSEYTANKYESGFGYGMKCPARIGHLHGCRCFSNYARSWVGSTRSLNLHTAALERRLYLFRANKLRSLAFGTPHWGDASFVCPLRQRMPVPIDRLFTTYQKETENRPLSPVVLRTRRIFSFWLD